jgi:BirA family biotin operon repressor/biotin-[acetyl-CoA-carboxylase] ligase
VLTRDKVLKAFHGRPGKTISGALLAKELGLSRVAIWKQVQALREQGIPIQSDPKTGYRFSAIPDLSLTEFHCPKSLEGWLKFHYEISSDSTQKSAKKGAQEQLQEGHLWISEVQTSGRGRLERVWESPFGGLWFSLLLRPSLPASRVPPMTLVAALTLAETASELIEQNIYLKWPNDLVVWRQNRWMKVAGILTEMSGETDRTEWVVMGIGMNVNNEISVGLQEKAIALQTISGKVISRATLLAQFLQKFRPVYQHFQKQGFAPFQKRYWERYGQANRSVCIQTSQGEVQGTARGVDPTGMLIVESRRKMRHISEGEIAL